MNVPPWASFVADFPDDGVEAGGDIQVYGGRNVAVALGNIFAGLGCSRISEPESQGDQGWAFDVNYGACRCWCRVQSFHPVFWLLFDDVSGSTKGAVAYVELWRKFGNALELDPRFHKILWRPFKEGPPHWDEVEVAPDPPDRTFDEEYPSSEIEPTKRRAGCMSVAVILIWVWFLLSAILTIVVGMISKLHKERPDILAAGIFVLVLCLAPPLGIVFETLKGRRKRRDG